MAWIMGTKYDRGRIAHVKNGESIPRCVTDGVWTGAVVEDEFGRLALKGFEVIAVSHAREIPRKWRHCQPGYRGHEVRYDPGTGYFIDA